MSTSNEDLPSGIEIDAIYGKCPVQADGKVDGDVFYFRARGQSWTMSIGGSDVIGDPNWQYEEPYGEGAFEAGWMEKDEARGFILQAITAYRAEHEAGPVTVGT